MASHDVSKRCSPAERARLIWAGAQRTTHWQCTARLRNCYVRILGLPTHGIPGVGSGPPPGQGVFAGSLKFPGAMRFCVAKRAPRCPAFVAVMNCTVLPPL